MSAVGGPLAAPAAALASGALLAVAGRPWWGAGWLALIAFVPLLGALRSERRAWRAGLLVGLTAAAPAHLVYEALGPFAPWLLPCLAAVASLPFAALGALAPRLRTALGRRGLLLAFPVLWAAAEALPGRPWLLGRVSNPLFAVGYSQAGLPTMQLARVGGITGVGLAVLACNALLALWVFERARWPLAGLLALATAVAASAGPARTPAGHGATAGVRVVQRALPDAAYAAAAELPAVRTALTRGFTLQAGAAPLPPGPGFSVLPEGALPGPLAVQGATGLEPLLQGLGPALLGAAARRSDGVANGVFVWQRGVLRHVYDKRRLAPLAEAGLVPGNESVVTPVGGVRVAPLVCLEAAFPGLARRAALDGAQVIAVLTNDAFARGLGTPEQHLRVARFRAVETGLPLAFASNAGPSAVIDGAGRILARTPAGRPAAAAAVVSLTRRPAPYLRWGDWPGRLALAGAGLLALIAGARGGALGA